MLLENDPREGMSARWSACFGTVVSIVGINIEEEPFFGIPIWKTHWFMYGESFSIHIQG